MKLKYLYWFLLVFALINYLMWAVGSILDLRTKILCCFALSGLLSGVISIGGFYSCSETDLNKEL